MKKIMHISTFLQGGAGKIICELAEDQAQRSNTVTCITNRTSYSNYFNYPAYETRLANIGVKLIKINELFKRKSSGITQASKLVAEQLLHSDYNLIHCHSAIPSLVALRARELIKVNIPIIYTMHGWGNNKSRAQETMDIDTLSNVDHVVAVSKSSKQLLIDKGMQNKNISVIYNGIANNDNITFQKQNILFNNLPQDAFVIACIGSICERKNQGLLLLAVENLIASGENIYCTFIGEYSNNYAQNLIKYVDSSGLSNRVKFPGYLDHADQYLSQLDALILPTKAEGLPLSIIEAFRKKIIVIASDIPECRELVQHNVSGLLFTSNSIDSLTFTLLQLINLKSFEKLKIIDYAYSQYQNKFKESIMFECYNDLYLKLLNKFYK